MTAARCPTCDRDGTSCPTLETLIRGTLPMSEVRDIALAAMRDCAAHRVDWRARALAAEASVEEIGKELDTLRDDIAEHLPAYMLGDGDDAEKANPREVVEFAGAELRRASKDAARWRLVAPLIERLRGARSIFDATADRAAPEGDTP